MVDITKEFVTPEIALKLKELGFNEPCLGIYDTDFKLYTDSKSEHFESQEKVQYIFGNIKYKIILAPLWQQVFDWFFDKHGIIISFQYNITYDNTIIKINNIKTMEIYSISEMYDGYDFPKLRNIGIFKAIDILNGVKFR